MLKSLWSAICLWLKAFVVSLLPNKDDGFINMITHLASEPDKHWIDEMREDPLWETINQAALDARICYRCNESLDEPDIAKGCKCPGTYMHRMDKHVQSVLAERARQVNQEPEPHIKSLAESLHKQSGHRIKDFVFKMHPGTPVTRKADHVYGGRSNTHFLELASSLLDLYKNPALLTNKCQGLDVIESDGWTKADVVPFQDHPNRLNSD